MTFVARVKKAMQITATLAKRAHTITKMKKQRQLAQSAIDRITPEQVEKLRQMLKPIILPQKDSLKRIIQERERRTRLNEYVAEVFLNIQRPYSRETNKLFAHHYIKILARREQLKEYGRKPKQDEMLSELIEELKENLDSYTIKALDQNFAVFKAAMIKKTHEKRIEELLAPGKWTKTRKAE